MQYFVPIALIVFLIAYFVRKKLIKKRLEELAKTHTSDHTTYTWDLTDKRCIHGELLGVDLNEKLHKVQFCCRWPQDHDLKKYPNPPTEEEKWQMIKIPS